MATDQREVLTVLRNELAFLEKGGYRETARAAWRPQFVFQDSPTCLNFDPTQSPRSCSECLMMEFVPEPLRRRRVPCRYIPIAGAGRTIEWYYRSGTQQDLDAALAAWLRKTIAGLEEQRASAGNGNALGGPEIHVRGHFAKSGE